jgi:hypothetical protein
MRHRGGPSYAPLALLVILCGATYVPFLGGGILTDDFVHLTRQLTRPTLLNVVITPDSFHFYRPVVQITFWLNTHLSGMNPVTWRMMNLLLHIGVVVTAFLLARKLLNRPRAAFLATLAFALTPKAHPIGVLWISARGDLLMALFSILAMLAWLRWAESNRSRWFVASFTCYLIALLSKETAILLPFLLLLTPASRSPITVIRAAGASVMIAGAAVVIGLRAYIGAVMPTTLDAHYGLVRPAGRWVRNLENYAGRAMPAAIGLLGIVGVPAWFRRRTRITWDRHALNRQLIFAIAWFAVFTLPVLPIPARSELYLYLPGLGMCFLAGSLVDSLLDDVGGTRPLASVSLGAYILIFGGYQLSRSRAIHEDLTFSAELIKGMRVSLDGYSGPVSISPADTATAQFLADSVGGYADLALKMATGRYEVNGIIDYANEGSAATVLRLKCAYRNGKVVLTRSDSAADH